MNIPNYWLYYASSGDRVYLVKEDRFALLGSEYRGNVSPWTSSFGSIDVIDQKPPTSWHTDNIGQGLDGSLILLPNGFKINYKNKKYYLAHYKNNNNFIMWYLNDKNADTICYINKIENKIIYDLLIYRLIYNENKNIDNSIKLEIMLFNRTLYKGVFE